MRQGFAIHDLPLHILIHLLNWSKHKLSIKKEYADRKSHNHYKTIKQTQIIITKNFYPFFL